MFQEILVVDYISDYSKLTDAQIETLSSGLVDKNFLKNCPDGTVIGVRIGRGSNLQKKVYYPFFSHVGMPIKAGERAWAFEQGDARVSYWVTRKVQNKSAEDLNFTNDDNARLYEALSANPDASIDTREAVSRLLYDSNASGVNLSNTRKNAISRSQFAGEPVAPITKLSPDLTIQGSNNTAVRLGDLGAAGTGTIEIVAGIASVQLQETVQNENNKTTKKPLISSDAAASQAGSLSPDDESRITISRLFNPDEYYQISIGNNEGSAPSVAIKSDKIRIKAESDLKITTESDSGNVGIIMDGSKVTITDSTGISATDVIVDSSAGFQESLAAALTEIVTVMSAIGVPSPNTISLIGLLNSRNFSSKVTRSD